MARKMIERPSKRGPITKIMPSDGCKGDTVPLTVGKWYDFHEFGWHLGNVGSYLMDPGLENVIRQALAHARATGKDHLTQTEEAVRDVLKVRHNRPAIKWHLLFFHGCRVKYLANP